MLSNLNIFLGLLLVLVAAIPSRGSILPRDWSLDENRYLVVLKPDATERDVEFHNLYSARFHTRDSSTDRDRDGELDWFTFEENGKLIRGYSIVMDPDVLWTLSRDPAVDVIEEDALVQIWGGKNDDLEEPKVQHDAPWGLARISHRTIPSVSDYLYEDEDGKGVDVYVIDTGIRVQHHDFDDRAKLGKMFLSRPVEPPKFEDDNGHGTHCAGTIAGKTYGVCKRCKVIAVKVLDRYGSGTMSDVIAGIEYVTKRHKNKESAISVINMSLGGGYTETINRVVNAASDAGIHVVVAAGNAADDTCDYSPASAESAIAVGATDSFDSMAEFSNYGNCTAIFAPGVHILSTWNGDDDSTSSLSGTSMASPHVAGVVAALLSRSENLHVTPKEMKQMLRDISTRGVIKNIPSDLPTDNFLLFNGVGERDSGGDVEHVEL